MKTYLFSGRSITWKMVLIAGLIIGLLIPQALLENLVQEREGLQRNIQREVSKAWGNIQLLSGPFLVVPYYQSVKAANGNYFERKLSHLVLFPEMLNIQSGFSTSTKKRSLYRILLYQSDHSLQGKFDLHEILKQGISSADLVWNAAYLAMGISDSKGISKEVNITVNGKTLKMNPGIPDIDLKINPVHWQQSIGESGKHHMLNEYEQLGGMHVNLNDLHDIGLVTFSFELSLNGSQGIFYSPLAKTTEVNMKSSFAEPSFIGDFLPTSHQITNSGFTADWKVLEYNKRMPSLIKGASELQVSNSIFGIQIKEPVDHYAKNARAVKYMVLVVLLMFLTVFLTETLYKLRIHIFQYLMVGLAIAIFFTLLLSLSEYIYFNYAYILSSSIIIGLIYWYSLSLFNNRNSSLALGSLSGILFSYIFIILQLQQYALLAGALGLLLILFLTMYFTRKIIWYEDQTDEKNVIF